MDNNADGNAMEDGCHHVHWNDLLPYPIPSGTEHFEAVLAEMRAALQKVDLFQLLISANKFDQYSHNIMSRLTRTIRMLDLKLHLEDGQWTMLIGISYELVVNPPCSHAPLMDAYASLLLRILRLPVAKQYSGQCDIFSNRVASLKLEFEWRPLFKVVIEYLYQPARQAKLYKDEACVKDLIRLAEHCRKYFCPSTSEELLEEVKHWLCPIQSRYLSQLTSILVLFFPNAGFEGSPLVEWLRPTTGVLWSSTSRRLEALNMLLISRMVKGHVQVVDWDQWAPQLFNTLKRHLKLPGSEGGPKSIPKWNPEEKPGNRIVRSIHSDYTRYFAKWLVRSITDANGLLGALEIWLQSLDTFFHPSNEGSWSTELCHLLSSLVDAMNKRIFRKGFSYTLPPLSTMTVDRFASIVWPAANKLIFSKSFFGSIGAQDVIKGLANLSPQLILSQVIALAEPSLESLTEPHRTNASIGVLAVVARKIQEQANFPAGVSVIVNLLPSILPGLDSNDPLKTINTLAFMSNALSVMPLHDISNTFASSEDCVDNANAESTASLESFVLLFLDQCFHYLSNMTKPSEGNELGSSAMLINTWDIFFMQLSPQLMSMALEKIMAYAREETHIYSATALGYLVGKAAMRSPEYPRILNAVMDQVKEQLERGLGSDENQTDETCARLICFLSMLYRLLHYFSGSNLDISLISSELLALMKQSSCCKQKTVVKLTAKCFKSFVKALTGIYPIDWSSCQDDKVQLADFGRLFKLSEVKLNWHLPSESDLNVAIGACQHFITEIIDKIEFLRTKLVFLRCALKAVLSLRSNAKIVSSHISPMVSQCDKIFESLSQRLLSLNASLITVEQKSLLISSVGIALTYRGISRSTYADTNRTLRYLKSGMTYYKKDPLKPRYWYAKRAFLLHLCRLEHATYADVERTPHFTELIGVLFSYSTDHITELSSEAQAELTRSVYNSAHLTRTVTDFWAKEISRTDLDEDALKALASLRDSALNVSICSDWPSLCQFLHWIAPLNDRPGIEKIPQIYDLITGLFINTAQSFTAPPSQYTSGKLEALLQVEVSRAYNANRETIRSNLINFMISSYQSATWRSKIMITTYLLIILNNQDPISDDLVRLFVDGVASDVFDVRFSSLQAAKVGIHAWNLQRQPSGLARWTDRNLNCDNNSIGKKDLLQPATEMADYKFNGDFFSEDLLRRLVRISEIEENDDAAKLEFRIDTCRLVQSLADVAGPKMLTVLKAAMVNSDDTWSPGKQRAYAEWIGGLLKSFHFTLSQVQYGSLFKTEIVPLIKLAWSRCGIDSARYWFGALFFACRYRSKEMVLPLLQFVSSELQSVAMSASSTQTVLVILSMHAVLKATGSPLDNQLGLINEKLFTSTYLVVRREAALLAREIQRNSQSNLLIPTDPSVTMVKSLIELAHASFMDPVLSGAWKSLDQLLPLFLASHHSDEIEMQLATKQVCKRLAWLDYCPSASIATSVVDCLLQVASDQDLVVHVRKLTVEVIGLFYGRNYALFDDESSRGLLRALVGLTGDAQLDVREAASTVLTSFLHTRHSLADELASSLLVSLKSQLPSIKSPHQIPHRHSLILQSSSLILSMPYRLSPLAPGLLLLLTRFLPDRAPIQGTVRKTFSEFKRTHMDNWAQERLVFGEEELDAISELLVSPSYYA